MLEQAHGVGASTMGSHSLLSEEGLLSRMMIHQCRAVVEQSELEQTIVKIEARIDSLERAMKNVSLGTSSWCGR